MVAEPQGQVAQQFMTLGAAVVQEISKLKLKARNTVRSASCSHMVKLCGCSKLDMHNSGISNNALCESMLAACPAFQLQLRHCVAARCTAAQENSRSTIESPSICQ